MQCTDPGASDVCAYDPLETLAEFFKIQRTRIFTANFASLETALLPFHADG